MVVAYGDLAGEEEKKTNIVVFYVVDDGEFEVL